MGARLPLANRAPWPARPRTAPPPRLRQHDRGRHGSGHHGCGRRHGQEDRQRGLRRHDHHTVSVGISAVCGNGIGGIGIDVASGQHPDNKDSDIDWPDVAAAGYRFAAIKSTEGN
ncbi:MAG TPA: hypothetical protein VGG75_40815 [Trebonia sp.]